MNYDVTEQAPVWLEQLFAPWVKSLGLQVISARNGQAHLRLPYSEQICREGGTVCGQALMAAADTAMVFAICSSLGEFRPMTTVSLNTSFMRSVSDDVRILAEVRKPGRSVMFGNIDMFDSNDKLIAQSTTSYMLV